MKTNKFPKLVINEATKLRELITEEERNKLDFENFNPESTYRCIYGLISGDCLSSRAVDLIENCASRVYIADSVPKYSKRLNGSPKKKVRNSLKIEYWSPIEKFIQLAPEDMNKKLIQFLKKEIDTLE